MSLPGTAAAYIDAPPPLARLIRDDAASLVAVKVEKVSKEKGAIIYKKVAVLKGKHPGERIKQAVSRRLRAGAVAEESPRPCGGRPDASLAPDHTSPPPVRYWVINAESSETTAEMTAVTSPRRGPALNPHVTGSASSPGHLATSARPFSP